MSYSLDLQRMHQALWRAMQGHRFVKEMADDSIDEAVFDRYRVQERAFVRVAIRVFAFACARADDDADALALAAIVRDLADRHDGFFKGDAVDAKVPRSALELCEVALDIANTGSTFEILSAMLAAEWTYATWCSHALASGKPQGPRRDWIALHTEPAFTGQVAWIRQRVDAMAAVAPIEERARAATAFERMLQAEIRFHDVPYAEAEVAARGS